MWFIFGTVTWWWVRGRRHAVLCLYWLVPLVLASATTPNPTYGGVSTELILCVSVHVCVCVWNKYAHVYVCVWDGEKEAEGQKQIRPFKEKSKGCHTEHVCVCVCVCVRACDAGYNRQYSCCTRLPAFLQLSPLVLTDLHQQVLRPSVLMAATQTLHCMSRAAETQSQQRGQALQLTGRTLALHANIL